MRSIVVTQSEIQLGSTTETFLFSALAGLGRPCDSLQSCRVHLEGGGSSAQPRKPFCVTLYLSAGEHHIAAHACDGTNNVLTARDVIRTAIGVAEDKLRNLKLTNECTSCCNQ